MQKGIPTRIILFKKTIVIYTVPVTVTVVTPGVTA